MKTVLVIDDERATLTMFRLFLRAYGYGVLTAENGEAGLRLVDEHHPEIVFTDLRMPGMDGFEVLKQIRRSAPTTEVIVITGHGDMDQAMRALNLEAADFINKPIGRNALDAALKRAETRLTASRHDPVPLTWQVMDAVAIVSVQGTLSGRHHGQLLTAFKEAPVAGVKGVVIRFDSGSAVDGSGITLLARLLAEAKTAGTSVCFTGLSENFQTVLEMMGMTRSAPCIDPLEAAISALTKKPGVETA